MRFGSRRRLRRNETPTARAGTANQGRSSPIQAPTYATVEPGHDGRTAPPRVSPVRTLPEVAADDAVNRHAFGMAGALHVPPPWAKRVILGPGHILRPTVSPYLQ
jgi:hypothetical protein